MMKSRLIKYGLFLILTLLAVPHGVLAVGSPAQAGTGRTVRVGIYEAGSLASFDKYGAAHGFFVEMFNSIAKKEQWNVKYLPGSWQEGLDRLKSNKIDLVLCIGYTEERKKYMDFPKEYLLLNWGVLYKPKGSRITSLLELEGKSVSALKGDVYLTGFLELVRQFNINVKIQEVDQYSKVFKAVESGEVAAGIAGNLYGILNENGRRAEQTPVIFSPIQVGYAVNEGKNGDLIAALDRNIAAMKADKASNYYHELEHLLGNKKNGIPKEAYWALSSVAAALLIAIAFIVLLRRQVKAKTEHLEVEIAEHKQAEDALTESKELFSLFMKHSPIYTYIKEVTATESRVLQASDNFQEIIGIPGSEMIGKTMMELFPVEIGAASTDDDWKVVSSGDLLELEEKLNDRIYSSIKFPVVLRNKTLLAGYTFDITERKLAEKTLQLSEQKYSSLFNLMPDMVGLTRMADGCFIEVNAGFERWSGWKREEVLGKSSIDLGLWSHEARAEAVAIIQKQGYLDGFEYMMGTKSGEQRDALMYLIPIVIQDEKCLYFMARDITNRKRTEENRLNLEKQLLHAQKLESLGVLAGGIAHDFNNLLMAIMGNADLALMRLNPESPAIDNLKRIEQAAARAADLARQMLAYSGKGKFVVVHLDMSRLVEEMLHILEVSISKKAVLRLNLTHPIPSVKADATQLRQIIMNLVINASEAIGDKSGVIAISSGCMECDRNYLKDVWQDQSLTDGLYVYLEIADTGCGMDKETLSKLFDPFFTTKFTGRGLGMAAVLGIVRGHKGAIKVYSELNRGTTFKILLPASDRPAELFNTEAHTDDWQGSGTVLLVDDEETVRAIGGEMLRELGFTVITADDGREGITAYKQNPDIAFVILDLTMPHIDGEQCFRELRQLQPDVKVIMSSGFSEHEVTQKFAGKGLAGFIQKPYKLSALKNAIRGIV